jgi:hypothetical protein
VAARIEIFCVHIVVVLLQNIQPVGRVRAAFSVAFKRSPVPVRDYMLRYCFFGGKKITTLIALKSLSILMYLLIMFSEVDATLEQLLAFRIKTLEHSRRICIVSRHVQLVKKVVFDILTAQKARVQNGGVNSFLVLF